MEYTVKFHDQLVMNIKPSIQGWMWPEHDNMFQWFADEIPKYVSGYLQYCRQFKVAVQAGGHSGVFPRILSTLFETVYTFEPDGYSFHCLVNNCNLDTIKKFNCALGGTHDMLYQKYRGQYNMGVNNYGLPIEGEDPITLVRDVVNSDEPALVNIPQIRIDDLGLENCDLIHLDVEGYEGNVIDGATQTIEKFKPLLLWESMPQKTVEYLQTLGYHHVQFASSGDTMYRV